MRPLVTSVVEKHQGGKAFATVTLEVDLVDAVDLLAHCDTSQVAGAGLEKTIDSAKALQKIRAAELAGAAAAAESAPPQEPEKPLLTGQALLDAGMAKHDVS